MELPEFLRVFEVRGQNLTWFLGAGCSICAGIPSANDIIWDCKSRIYCSEQGVARATVADISNPLTRKVIHDTLTLKNIYPKTEEDGDEYTYYFEKAISSQLDRQTYIKGLVSRAVPSYGHLILASLAKVSKAPIVWTTNFDKLYENAVYEIFGSVNDLVVADLGEPEKAVRALDAKTFPMLVKLHGDYHSERLKNTKPELRTQDERMREALQKACSNYGLCVIGYSGRDKSVMDALIASARQKGSYPHGLFWLVRAGTEPLDSVKQLIAVAQNSHIDAHLVEINTFDETFDKIRRYMGAFPDELEEYLKPKASRRTEAAIPAPSNKPPFLRLNALRVDTAPTMCKLVECEIGGYKDIQEAIKNTNATILARRIKKGVIAFGEDKEIKKAFAKHDIKSIQIYPIDPARLEYASEEYKLVFDSLCRAVERHTGLTIEDRRDGKYLVADEKITPQTTFNGLVDCAMNGVSGTVPSTKVEWQEACRIDLDCKFNKLWLLLSPRLLLTLTDDHSATDVNRAKSFARERTVPRRQPSTGQFVGYNPIAGSILAGWMSVLSGSTNSNTATLSAFGLSDGMDPQFLLSKKKVISGRMI